MSDYYGRDGSPMGRMDWAKSRDDKRVAETTLDDGTWISTVWLGIDHNWGDGPPLIFETMVFPSETDLSEQDCERYSTEEEAKAGHEAMVEKCKARTRPSSAEAATTKPGAKRPNQEVSGG